MKIESFDYFYNKEKDKKCLILGGAPSIKNIDVENFDGIIISMGDIPLRLKERCNIDYWINANSYFPIPDKDYEIINTFKNTTLIFSNTIIESRHAIDYSILKNNIKVPWFEYDQRHFNQNSCNHQIDQRFDNQKKLSCCNNIGDITIQEYLQNKFNLITHYSTADTVAVHALSFAIIMGCKSIYIGGVEIPMYEDDYNYYNTNILSSIKDMTANGKKVFLKKIINILFKTKIKSVFYPDIPNILKDFEYLNNLCIDNDIEIYNLNPKSILSKIDNFKFMEARLINEK